MSLSDLARRHEEIVSAVHDSNVHAMHVSMLARDPDDLPANVKQLIEEDPETAQEVLYSALVGLAVVVEAYGERQKMSETREGN